MSTITNASFTPRSYLKAVDRINEWSVSAFLVPGSEYHNASGAGRRWGEPGDALGVIQRDCMRARAALFARLASCKTANISIFFNPDIKLLILHEHRHDDGIRNFFLDVWELLVKVSTLSPSSLHLSPALPSRDAASDTFFHTQQTLMNPLHDPQAPIRASAFDARVRASARKHL